MNFQTDIPLRKPLPKGIVAHPARQHSHQTAFALQEGDMLIHYMTAIWYKPKQFPYSIVNRLPRGLKEKCLSLLKKRSFDPIDLDLVETYSLWKTLGIFGFDPLKAHDETHVYENNRCFDQWVARKLLRDNFDFLVGYETACLHSFRACKRRGIPCILDLAAVHWSFQKKVFEEEEVLGNPAISVNSKLLSEMQELKSHELVLADYVFAPSSYVKGSLMKGGVDKDKIILIPYGVDLALFKNKESYKKNSEFTILYVGSITPAKGLRYLLKAFDQLKLPQSRLILVGGMVGGEELLSSYAGSYTHIPFLPQERLAHFYQSADLFVFPSLLDNFGMVVLEAMACGTPVIVSENTGAKDVVRDGKDGFIVPVRDVETLKQRIRYLYERCEKLEEMGRNASLQAQMYSWETYREKIRGFIMTICEQHNKNTDLCKSA